MWRRFGWLVCQWHYWVPVKLIKCSQWLLQVWFLQVVDMPNNYRKEAGAGTVPRSHRIELSPPGSKRTVWPKQMSIWNSYALCKCSKFTFVRFTTFCQNLWTGLLNVGLRMRKAKNNSLMTVFGSHLMVGSSKCDCGLRLNSHFFS